MRMSVIGIVAVYLVVACAEVTLHWYLGTRNSPRACFLRDVYLYRDPDGGKDYYPGLVGVILPAVVLGIATGSIGSRWSCGGVIWCVLALSAAFVATFPLCFSWFSKGQIAFWPETNVERITTMFWAFLKVCSFCAVSAYGARNVAQYYQHPELVDRPAATVLVHRDSTTDKEQPGS